MKTYMFLHFNLVLHAYALFRISLNSYMLLHCTIWHFHNHQQHHHHHLSRTVALECH